MLLVTVPKVALDPTGLPAANPSVLVVILLPIQIAPLQGCDRVGTRGCLTVCRFDFLEFRNVWRQQTRVTFGSLYVPFHLPCHDCHGTETRQVVLDKNLHFVLGGLQEGWRWPFKSLNARTTDLPENYFCRDKYEIALLPRPESLAVFVGPGPFFRKRNLRFSNQTCTMPKTNVE